jgi:hypothetical protein
MSWYLAADFPMSVFYQVLVAKPHIDIHLDIDVADPIFIVRMASGNSARMIGLTAPLCQGRAIAASVRFDFVQKQSLLVNLPKRLNVLAGARFWDVPISFATTFSRSNEMIMNAKAISARVALSHTKAIAESWPCHEVTCSKSAIRLPEILGLQQYYLPTIPPQHSGTLFFVQTP